MFHFTTRELVLVTVIVALFVGWTMDHWQVGRRNASLTLCLWETKRKLEALGYTVEINEDGNSVQIFQKQ